MSINAYDSSPDSLTVIDECQYFKHNPRDQEFLNAHCPGWHSSRSGTPGWQPTLPWGRSRYSNWRPTLQRCGCGTQEWCWPSGVLAMYCCPPALGDFIAWQHGFAVTSEGSLSSRRSAAVWESLFPFPSLHPSSQGAICSTLPMCRKGLKL